MVRKASVAGRVDSETNQLIEQAVEETETSKSEFVRRPIRYYVRKNPDDITTLYPTNSMERFIAEMVE